MLIITGFQLSGFITESIGCFGLKLWYRLHPINFTVFSVSCWAQSYTWERKIFSEDFGTVLAINSFADCSIKNGQGCCQHVPWFSMQGSFGFSFMNFCILLYSSSNFSLYVDRLYTKCFCLGGPFLSTLLYPSLILTSDLLLTLLVVGGRIMISFLTFGSQDFWGS